MRLRLTGLRLDGSLWVTKFNNYIYGDLTGNTCDENGVCVSDESGPLRELNYRQADASFRGAELKVILPLRELDIGPVERRTSW